MLDSVDSFMKEMQLRRRNTVLIIFYAVLSTALIYLPIHCLLFKPNLPYLPYWFGLAATCILLVIVGRNTFFGYMWLYGNRVTQEEVARLNGFTQ